MNLTANCITERPPSLIAQKADPARRAGLVSLDIFGFGFLRARDAFTIDLVEEIKNNR